MQLAFVTGATNTAVRTNASAGSPCAHAGIYSNAGAGTAPNRDAGTHDSRDPLELPSPTCLFRAPGTLAQQSAGEGLSPRLHGRCASTSSHDLNADEAAQRKNERGAGKEDEEGLAEWSRRGSAGRSSSSPHCSGSNATSTTYSNATSASSQSLRASAPSP